MKYPPIIKVEAIGLADAYHKLVKACMNEGAQKRREYGNTLDIISLCEIKNPLLEPMLHPDFPTKELHLNEYLKQWERGYDWKKQGFEYNYMDRLTKYPPVISHDSYGLDMSKNDYYHKSYAGQDIIVPIDQLEVIRNRIAKRIIKGGECLVSNRDRVITWIPDRDLFVDEDQPCLQSLQFFVYEYPVKAKGVLHDSSKVEYLGESVIRKGKGEFHVVWRSRDLYNAWNSNMIGLEKMVMREVFEPNNIKLIRVIDFNNSNHIYEPDWELAKRVRPAVINPMFVRE